jgi:RNA polymerase sigma factor (sigma-70 family)
MEHNDTELVSQSLTGSREAFGRIVEQYQSLICSLAYSATGSLTQSEDVAQETFVLAWKQLRQLREPAKLRAWLCTIARSVISRATQRQTREPVHGAETMDTAHETPALDAIPSERVINREEEAILWRSLAQIPEVYREPLILFYREQQSVAAVAEKLELSEDAVKQRLSRGRKLLTEEVTAFVEGTLQRTSPGRVFTLGVLASLPVLVTSAKAATLGAAAKGGATVKAVGGLWLLGVFFGPAIAVLNGFMEIKMDIDSAVSPRDRQFQIKMAKTAVSLAGAFALVMFAGMFFGVPRYGTTHPGWIIGAVTGLSWVYIFLLTWLVVLPVIRQRRLAIAEAARWRARGLASAAMPPSPPFFEYRSGWSLFGWSLIHICFDRDSHRGAARGWIACGNAAVGILFACGGAAIGGVAIGPCAIGVVAIGCCAVGYIACGGAAVAWLAGGGGTVVARDYAFGGVPVAAHATLVPHAWLYTNILVLLCCLPLLLRARNWRKRSRRLPALKP